MYEGTWERRDRWATLRSVIRAIYAFKTAHRYRQKQNARRSSISSLEDDDSDGAMSVDFSGPVASTSAQQNKILGSTDNLKGLCA